ncbi:IS630 family transposase [Marinobacter sp. 71-i]|uniref:IS630 family transposase n=1 Tax=Marinobacter iranensis TaxID=2962607 RepID=A0ABT5YGD3_9GAMM|nr:IS630 family transposase [Marinobacter iranensis]MDF0752766.1 IS630 family transposase [Marinobacter iranensis]
MARKPASFNLAVNDQLELESWLRTSTLSQSLVQRARIVLALNAGESPKEVAERLETSTPTVFKWRNRYIEQGLSGLQDAPRPGQPRKLDQKKVKSILDDTVKKLPKESTHWSVRLMAEYAGVSRWQVHQIWKAADLKPHRLKTFKISNDPDFAEKVFDVVGLYLNPPDNALVLSVDEKTQIQALDRTQPKLQLKPGQIERRTHDYKRHGTTSLYAALNILNGEVIGRITQRHRAKEFLDFLRQIDRETPKEQDLHLILDNSSTHKTPEVKAWLEKHPRFKLHFTPTSASWLNAVEGWFGQLERRALYRGIFTSVGELKTVIRRFIKTHNEKLAKPFRWHKSAESIMTSVARAKLSVIDNK